MKAFVFATPMEASPLCAKLGITLDKVVSLPLAVRFEKPFDLMIVVTGMGRGEASKNLEWFLAKTKPEALINAGIAGALKDIYSIGDILRAKEAIDLKNDKKYQCSGDAGSELREAVLATVGEPVFDSAVRLKLALYSDIVDMEGAVYAGICERLSIPFAAIKCISDMAGHQGRESLLKNLDLLSEKLAEYLYQSILKQ